MAETEGLAEMGKEEAMKLLLKKAEALVDETGVFEDNPDLYEEQEGEEEEEDERKGNQFAKLMAEHYEPDEQGTDIELYGVDWEKAHKEAFGDVDLDAINTNVG